MNRLSKHLCPLIIFLALFIVGCQATKFVPKDDFLYTGAEISIQTQEKKKYRKRLRANLQQQLKPKPNEKIAGLPVKLGIYNLMGKTTKTKGMRSGIKRKFGEAPVLYSKINPGYTAQVLSAALYNKGFFDAQVTYSVVKNEKKKKVKIVYLVKTGSAYRIGSYNTITKRPVIDSIIAANAGNSLIKIDKRYNLDRLKRERERLSTDLQNAGYYHFSPEYFSFDVDTSGRSLKAFLRLKIKPETPEQAFRRYTLEGVYVALDTHYISRHSHELSKDTIVLERVHMSVSEDFKPLPIARYVYLKEGDYYSRENYQLTLNRLMGMNLFKYADIELHETADSTHLNAIVTISPLQRKSISAEVQAVTKSNNFIGPGVNINFMNRNTFRGGEKLNINFHGAIETQLNGQFKGLYTYEIGPQVSLAFPRLIIPFYVKPSSYFTPQTIFSVNYSFLRRVDYFDMRTLQIAYGYKWKETMAVDHELKPISFSYFNIRNVTSTFTELMEMNPALQRRYENQLIAGIMYSYTYNQQVFTKRKNQIYFNGNIDLAGNTMSVLNKINGGKENEIGTNTVAGVAYAQYARFDIDLRNYYHINRKSTLAARMIVGWGIPYGNSTALPYVKGFFSGGASSVRAFPVNSLGPGTYRLPDSLQSSYFIQQGGDIKLEWSAEYRFPVIGFLKGAVFTDIGNTWLSRNNDLLPGGQFKLNQAIYQLAIGAGVGVRVDLKFFIIRLDVATPLKKPWLESGQRWVLDDVDLGSRAWRRENLILNIAIGYPF